MKLVDKTNNTSIAFTPHQVCSVAEMKDLVAYGQSNFELQDVDLSFREC